MLIPYKIGDYYTQYRPEWTCLMPQGCPPEDVSNLKMLEL